MNRLFRDGYSVVVFFVVVVVFFFFFFFFFVLFCSLFLKDLSFRYFFFFFFFHSTGKFSQRQIDVILLFFPENRLWPCMQIVFK